MIEPRTTKIAIARAISIGGHPLIFIPLAILIARSNADVAATMWIIGVTVAAMALLAVFVVLRVRRGEYTDVDVSKREHRPRMYLVAIAATAASSAALYFSGQPRDVVHGSLTALALLILSGISNQLGVKASLHTSFGVYAAAVMATHSVEAGVLGLAIAIAVAWSRIALDRHTPREVAAGFVLGACSAAILFFYH